MLLNSYQIDTLAPWVPDTLGTKSEALGNFLTPSKQKTFENLTKQDSIVSLLRKTQLKPGNKALA